MMSRIVTAESICEIESFAPALTVQYTLQRVYYSVLSTARPDDNRMFPAIPRQINELKRAVGVLWVIYFDSKRVQFDTQTRCKKRPHNSQHRRFRKARTPVKFKCETALLETEAGSNAQRQCLYGHLSSIGLSGGIRDDGETVSWCLGVSRMPAGE
jgi:hypothetical protein